MKIYMMHWAHNGDEVTKAFSSKQKRREQLSWLRKFEDYDIENDGWFHSWEVDVKPTKADMIRWFNSSL